MVQRHPSQQYVNPFRPHLLRGHISFQGWQTIYVCKECHYVGRSRHKCCEGCGYEEYRIVTARCVTGPGWLTPWRFWQYARGWAWWEVRNSDLAKLGVPLLEVAPNRPPPPECPLD